QLVAYIVANREQTAADELRDFLKHRLPDFMIPSAFVMLDAMPLMPNGKVDRGALPPPDVMRLGREPGLVKPRTPSEEALAEIFSEVLSVKQVGIDENFFELGGHSLLATQVLSRIRERLHIDLPLQCFFVMPTIRSLAIEVERLQIQQLSNERV